MHFTNLEIRKKIEKNIRLQKTPEAKKFPCCNLSFVGEFWFFILFIIWGGKGIYTKYFFFKSSVVMNFFRIFHPMKLKKKYLIKKRQFLIPAGGGGSMYWTFLAHFSNSKDQSKLLYYKVRNKWHLDYLNRGYPFWQFLTIYNFFLQIRSISNCR